jgi:hypothetical protein
MGDGMEWSEAEQAITDLVRKSAERQRGNGRALLRLLRLLENLHQEVREGSFQEALPENRQALYALLKDIEAEGGWPYINRMRLRSLMGKLLEAEETGGIPEP